MAVKGLGIDLVDVAELRKKLSGRAGKRFAPPTAPTSASVPMRRSSSGLTGTKSI